MSAEFNFTEYSNVLFSIIQENLKDAGKPIVIGIHGEWGSGKSTLLNEIYSRVNESNYREESQFIIPIRFNAWRFEKEKHLIIPLLKTLYYKLEKLSSTDNKKNSSILKYIKDGLFSIISGVEIEFEIGFAKMKYSGKDSVLYADKKEMERAKEAKKVKNFSQKYESIYFDIIHKIADLTRDNSVRFLFLIDDLDRCLPENSVKMLESIKLFLDIPNCAFVMAIDKEVVEVGVEYHYKSYRDLDIQLPITGNEYLEKVITLPFMLPSIQKERIKEFIESQEKYKNLFRDDTEGLLELFYNTVPAIPRKFIRTLDLYSFKLKLNESLNRKMDNRIILIASLIELFIPKLYRYVKKEFERDKDSENYNKTFEILINYKNSANANEDKSILNMDIDDKNIQEILNSFKQSRNKFNIDELFDFILDYDEFQSDFKEYFIFNSGLGK